MKKKILMMLVVISSTLLNYPVLADNWKEYRNMRDVCLGVEGTIVTMINVKINTARYNAKKLEESRARGEDGLKSLKDLSAADESFDKAIEPDLKLWSQLNCVEILYGKLQ